MTRSLDEVKVDCDLADEHYHGHVEIIIGWAAVHARKDEESAAAFGHPSEADHMDAALSVAGLLGRLACAATPWIALSAQQHGCRTLWRPPEGTSPWHNEPETWGEGCHLSSNSVFNPLPDINQYGIDMRDEVEVFLTVPPEDARVWLERIRNWLQALAEPVT